MSMIAHPMTLGDDGTPKYSARDFRNLVNTFLAPADGSGAVNTVVEGVRLSSNQPICTVSGRTATIKTHVGIVNPYPAAGPYTYYTSDMPVTLPNTTQSWKIAVIIDDPSEGHGSSPQVHLDTFAASTPDSSIPGMVLALVHDGVADDIATRITTGSTIYTQTLAQLTAIKAVDGQTGVVRSTGRTYTSRNGAWYGPSSNLVITTLQSADSNNIITTSGSVITIDTVRRLMWVSLSSFHSNVHLSYQPILKYVSGPRPSADIGLGNLGFVLRSQGDPYPFVKSATWRASDGAVVMPDVGAGDNIFLQRAMAPLPDNVELI